MSPQNCATTARSTGLTAACREALRGMNAPLVKDN